MKLRIFVALFLTLTACAESQDSESGGRCEFFAMSAGIEYPDGEVRKSDVYLCEAMTCRFIPVNGGASTFEGTCPDWLFE